MSNRTFKVGDRVTLADIYGEGNTPDQDELLWSFISPYEYNELVFVVGEFNPIEAMKTMMMPAGDMTIKEGYKSFATRDQRSLVASIVQDIKNGEDQGVIVLNDGDLIDGYHRCIAYDRRKVTKALFVDLCCPEDE